MRRGRLAVRLFAELKRRNVIRMAGLYLVGGWIVVQVAETLLPIFHTPDWVLQALVVLLALGFVAALVFSWVFEMTPEGLKRDADAAPEAGVKSRAGRRMDRMIVAGLLVVIGLMAAERFWSRDAAPPATADKATPADVSIAVLPLANLSGDPAQDYFSDGMSEELLNGLTKVEGLRVAARTSSFQFKGRNLDIQDVGRQLNVATVLEGSLRKSGQRVRITTQLIDAKTGYHLWSETYDRELDDIFAIQDDISAKVVHELRTRLGLAQASGASPESARSTSTEAYDLYLQGRGLLRTRESASIAQGLAALQRATVLDPDFAPAWAQLAHAYFISRRAQTGFGDIPIPEAEKLARAALANARRLDPELAEGYAVEGMLRQFLGGDLDGAAKAYEKAIARNPSHSEAFAWRADLFSRMGRYREALDSRIELAGRDPLFNGNNESLVIQLSKFGREQHAAPYLERLSRSSKTSFHFARSTQFMSQAQWDRAALELLRDYEEFARVYSGRRALMNDLVMLGLYDDAEQVRSEEGDLPLAGKGEWAGAVMLTDSEGIAPPEQRRSFWYYRRGQALFRAGRTAEAIEQFELIDTAFPFGLADDPIYVSPRRIWYALALREVGRDADADRVEDVTRADVAAAHRDGLTIPILDLLDAELALFEGKDEAALKSLPRGLMAEPFLSSIESDPLYAAVVDHADFKRAVAGERSRRDAMRKSFLQESCKAPESAKWRPLPESCASVGLKTASAG